MRNNDYYRHADQAVELERKGDYPVAANAWRYAAANANKKQNRRWAINRACFCERLHLRPFKGVY